MASETQAGRVQRVEYINERTVDFRPSKFGDVGHDLHAWILKDKQSWIDKAWSRIADRGRDIVTQRQIIWPFQTKLINSGIYLNQPNHIWCQIVARSSTTKKHLMVFNGIIDSGYQGELFMVLRNLSLIPRVIKNRERYAQAIFFYAVRPTMCEVSHFTEGSERGSTGFGSSGR